MFTRRGVLKTIFPASVFSFFINKSFGQNSVTHMECSSHKENIEASNFYFTSVNELRKKNGIESELIYIKKTRPTGSVDYIPYKLDSKDKVAKDNGWLIIVTKDGKRYKRFLNNENINLEWAEIKDGDDIAQSWQDAIDFLIYSSQLIDFYALPAIEIPRGKYKITNGIICPPFVKNVAMGQVIIDGTDYEEMNSPIFWIKGYKFNYDQQLLVGEILSATMGGGFTFIGPLPGSKKHIVVLRIGNTDKENGRNGFSNCNISMSNVHIKRGTIGLELTSFDVFLCSFSYCTFGPGSYKNICVSDIFDRKSNNAGERISFTDCVIYGGGQGAHVFISVPGFNIDFTNVSFDYCFGDYIYIDASYTKLRIINCHMEGFDGYVINSNDTKKISNCVVSLFNTDIMSTLGDGNHVKIVNDTIISANSICRPFFNHFKGVQVVLNQSGNVSQVIPPFNENIFWMNPKANGDLKIINYQGEHPKPISKNKLMLCIENFNEEKFSYTNSDIINAEVDHDLSLNLRVINNTAIASFILNQTEFLPCTQLHSYAAVLFLGFSDKNETLKSNQQLYIETQYIWFDYNQKQILQESVNVSFQDMLKSFEEMLPNISKIDTFPVWPLQKQAPPCACYFKVRWHIGKIENVINLKKIFVWEI
ncbi:Tat (twin-arginine translocation) pathway signal sequence [Klebsiella quasipneumoniae]|uniref:Tat (twin-arginine translocation) pathway signal sequence n=1 Tax=Klebsiella quasipneumoniae TaxID=1463165 RepID=UPI003D77BD37